MSFQPSCAYGKEIAATKRCFGIPALTSITIKARGSVLPSFDFSFDTTMVFAPGDYVLWSIFVGTGSGGHAYGSSPDGAVYVLLQCVSNVDYTAHHHFPTNDPMKDGHWVQPWAVTGAPWLRGYLGNPATTDNATATVIIRTGDVPGAAVGEGYLHFKVKTTRSGYPSNNGSFSIEWQGDHFHYPTKILDEVTPLGNYSPSNPATIGIFPLIPNINLPPTFNMAAILDWQTGDGFLTIDFWVDSTRRVTHEVVWDTFYSVDDTLQETRDMLNSVSFDDPTFLWNTGVDLHYDTVGNLIKIWRSLRWTEALPAPFTARNIPIRNLHINAYGSFANLGSGWRLSKAAINTCGPYAKQLYEMPFGNGAKITTCTAGRTDGLEIIKLDVPDVDDHFMDILGIIPGVLATDGNVLGLCQITPPHAPDILF